MSMFIKLGNYIFNTDVVAYIKIVGAGCDVHLKDDTRVSIANVTESDKESALAILSELNS